MLNSFRDRPVGLLIYEGILPLSMVFWTSDGSVGQNRVCVAVGTMGYALGGFDGE